MAPSRWRASSTSDGATGSRRLSRQARGFAHLGRRSSTGSVARSGCHVSLGPRSRVINARVELPAALDRADERSNAHPVGFDTVCCMSVVDKALWVIERNSSGELNLPALAEACGVSRSHLASAFGSRTGWPVMKYLRARRLTRAAETLARGAPDILAVALDAGYGSHEAFTRAFRDQFGVPPERVRERGSTEALALVAPLDLKARAQPVLAPPWVRSSRARSRAVGSTHLRYGHWYSHSMADLHGHELRPYPASG